MSLYWNAWAVPGLLAGLVAFAFAGLVLRSDPGRPENRRLSLVLMLEGVAVGAGAGLIYIVNRPVEAYVAQALSVTAVLLLPALNLYFLSLLDTPIVRPLRSLPGRMGLGAIALGSELWWLLDHRAFVPRVSGPQWYARFDADFGPTYAYFRYFALFVLLFGLVASLATYRTAQTQIERERARIFALAFGTRDALQVLLILLIFGLPSLQSGAVTGVQSVGNFMDLLGVVAYPILTFLYIPLLAYGILKVHLFDIDVRIKWTVKNSTIAAIFVAVFFVVSEVAKEVFSARLNSTYVGIAATGLLVFALAPLQRLAERLAGAAVHGAKSMAEMSPPERLQLYREQVQYAWADGVLNRKERLLLDHLQRRLGITPVEAAQIEIKVAATGAPALPRGGSVRRATS